MDFYDWTLALHVLAGFSIAAALVLYSTMVVAGRRADTLEGTRHIFRLAPAGTPLMAAGMILTLVLGIVLAVDADAFQVWDPWVLAAIVLWALFGEVGRRTGVYYTETQKLAESGDPGVEPEVLARLRAPDGARLHALGLLIFLLLVLDMIFKPGA